MMRYCIFSLLVSLVCLSSGPAHAQFQNDDRLIGRSIFDDTMAVVRGNSIVSNPFTQPFIATMDFDNTGGINNNLAGNLVMIDRGFPAGTGEVYIGATDGSGTTTLVGDFNGSFPGFNDLTGVVDFFEQVAVSPDNSMVALATPGDGGTGGFLLLFDYDPSMVGVDNTAVLTNGRQLNNAWSAFGTHDVEWMDNDTLLMVDGDAVFVDTIDLDVSGDFNVGSRTRHRELLGPTGGVQPLDSDSAPAAYNPDISPFIFIGAGDFDSGNASNYIWVLDPTSTEIDGDWKQVARARYDTGFNQGIDNNNTIRDMELQTNGDLAVTMFGGSLYTLDMSTLDGTVCGDPANFDLPDGGCGGLVDDTNATMIIDGDVEFDTDDPTDGQSNSGFSMMTIARDAAVSPGIPGDYDDSGQVGQGDLNLVLQNWGATPPPVPDDWINEQPADGVIIGQSNLNGVLQNWGNTAAVANASTVPEPSSLALLGLAFAMGIAGRRRK